MTKAEEQLRSNTWIVLIPTVAWFVGGWTYARYFQEAVEGRFDNLFAAGLSIPFLATAIAQIRSGFLWKNLARGNRGAHRSHAPRRFLTATALHLIAGLAIAGCFLVPSNGHMNDRGGAEQADSEAGDPSSHRPSTARHDDSGD